MTPSSTVTVPSARGERRGRPRHHSTRAMAQNRPFVLLAAFPVSQCAPRVCSLSAALWRMSKPPAARYRTTNWSRYNQALRKRGSLLIWLDKEMAWHAPPEGRPGRPLVFSNAAIQFCLSIKVLFKLPLRQTAGMVASLLRLAGLDWHVPDFSTLCRRRKTLVVQIPYRRADGLLSLLVDIEPGSATGSSEPARGIKFLGDGEWQTRKHGPQGRRQWRKVHLAMHTATSDIRAVEFTPSREGDSPVLPELPDQIPEGE